VCRSKARRLLTPLLLFNTAVGMAGTIWFAVVFYTEAFKGHGITFVEPNIAMATAEFVVTVLGILSMAAFYALWLREN